jgi:hypothetical protein
MSAVQRKACVILRKAVCLFLCISANDKLPNQKGIYCVNTNEGCQVFKDALGKYVCTYSKRTAHVQTYVRWF